MKLENMKSIKRNGSHFCKHCKINAAWLDGKIDGYVD